MENLQFQSCNQCFSSPIGTRLSAFGLLCAEVHQQSKLMECAECERFLVASACLRSSSLFAVFAVPSHCFRKHICERNLGQVQAGERYKCMQFNAMPFKSLLPATRWSPRRNGHIQITFENNRRARKCSHSSSRQLCRALIAFRYFRSLHTR